MTKLRLTLALLAIVSISLHASKTKYKLGKVTKEELSNTTCPIDDEADAYYIFDTGKSYIDFDNSASGRWVVKFTRKFKLKVLSKEGANAGNFIIPLYNYGSGTTEEITGLKGRTYNLSSGKVESIKLSSDNINEVQVNKYQKQIKYAMPQVKVGSIIEVEYTIESDFVSQYYSWYFQHEIPVMYSEYDIMIPDFFDYSSKVNGYIPYHREELSNFNQTFLIKYTDYSGTGLPSQEAFNLGSYSSHMIYSADSIEAFRNEPYTSSEVDNISRMHFQLKSVKHKNSLKNNIAESWENVDYRLLKADEFGGYLNQEKTFNRILDELGDLSPVAEERLTEIYMAIKSRLQWNEYYSLYADNSPSQVWKAGSANSAELNLILCGVLNAANISAKPVISCSKKRGYMDRFKPSISGLNHTMVIATVGTESLLLDLTGNTPPGLTPIGSTNVYGRIPGESFTNAWVDLSPKHRYKTHSLINVSLDPENNEISGQYQAILKDYAALEARSNTSKSADERDIKDYLSNAHPGLQIDNMSVQNIENILDDVKTNFDFTSNSSIQSVGDKYLVSLNLSNQIGENPFSGGDRKYPIDLIFGRDIKNNLTINIPEGYKVESLPEKQKIALPDGKGSFQYSVVSQGNIIQVRSVFLLNHRIFSSADFDYLKQFYSMVIEKLNEPIVISKI